MDLLPKQLSIVERWPLVEFFCALMKYGFFSWGHCIDNLFQEATAEDQGKLAKEYPLTVSLPKDCNDDRDEKEINRISKLSNGKI